LTSPFESPGVPRQEDWLIPERIEEIFRDGTRNVEPNPVLLSKIKESDAKGVPLPYFLQRHEIFRNQIARLGEGQDTPAIAEEMIEAFVEAERRYPGAVAWDGGRASGVVALFGSGHVDEANRLFGMISNPHRLVNTLLDLREARLITDEEVNILFGNVLNTADEERKVAIYRAMRDDLIKNDPTDVALGAYNDYISRWSGQPSFDWVSDWVSSQREVDGTKDWDSVEILIRDDSIYKNMPMPQRMFSQLIFLDTLEEIANDKMQEGSIESIADYYNNAQAGIYSDLTHMHFHT